MATATLSVWDAIAHLILAAPMPLKGTGGPLLGNPRFYRGTVSGTPAPGYIVFGARSEGQEGFYGRPGQSGSYRFHCWSDTADNAGRLYAWFEGLVAGQRLTLDGHLQWVGGSLRWVTDQPDTDGKAWQVIADLDVRSLG